nr:unnamed protein product [Leishmania braziliensis]
MGLESWPEFAALLAQLEELAKDPATAEGPEARRLEKAMADLTKLRAYDEAVAAQCGAVKEADLHERFPFLPEEPVPGMPLAEAELVADPEFRTLANVLVDLRRSPQTSPQALRAAEEALAGRAAEVAAAKLRATEEAQARFLSACAASEAGASCSRWCAPLLRRRAARAVRRTSCATAQRCWRTPRRSWTPSTPRTTTRCARTTRSCRTATCAACRCASWACCRTPSTRTSGWTGCG